MVKLIIFVVLGLLVGLGGGSAVSVMKAKKAFASVEAEQAKTIADSLASADEHGPAPTAEATAPSERAADSAHGPAAAESAAVAHTPPADTPISPSSNGPPPTVVSPIAKAPPPAADRRLPGRSADDHAKGSPSEKTVESHGAPGAAGPSKARLPLPPPKPIQSSVTSVPTKLAKIFGAMTPKDAAKVLEQLEDAEVQAIVSGLSDKQAAAILQNLPPQRAAAISRAALRTGVREP